MANLTRNLVNSATESPKTFQSFYPEVVTHFFVGPTTLENLSKELLKTMHRIIIPKSSSPIQKFYAVYLLLKISSLENKLPLMVQIAKDNELLTEIFRIAQVDLTRDIPINKRGNNFFGRMGSDEKLVQVGINLVRLCYESILHWGTKYGVTDTKHSLHVYHFLAESLKKKGKRPVRFYFINKEYDLSNNLATWDYSDHDPPLKGEIISLKDAQAELESESESESENERSSFMHSEMLSEAKKPGFSEPKHKINRSPKRMEGEKATKNEGVNLKETCNQSDKEEVQIQNKKNPGIGSIIQNEEEAIAKVRAARVEELLKSLNLKDRSDQAEFSTGYTSSKSREIDFSNKGEKPDERRSKKSSDKNLDIQSKVTASQLENKSFHKTKNQLKYVSKVIIEGGMDSKSSNKALLLDRAQNNPRDVQKIQNSNEIGKIQSLANLEYEERKNHDKVEKGWKSVVFCTEKNQSTKHDPFSKDPIPGQRIPGNYKIITQENPGKRKQNLLRENFVDEIAYQNNKKERLTAPCKENRELVFQRFNSLNLS